VRRRETHGCKRDDRQSVCVDEPKLMRARSVGAALDAGAPTEAALVRDALFLLQGIDGQTMAWSRDREAFELVPTVRPPRACVGFSLQCSRIHPRVGMDVGMPPSACATSAVAQSMYACLCRRPCARRSERRWPRSPALAGCTAGLRLSWLRAGATSARASLPRYTPAPSLCAGTGREQPPCVHGGLACVWPSLSG
jgi:hypothetical protein